MSSNNKETLVNNNDIELELIKCEIKDEEKEINNSEYTKCGEIFLANGLFQYYCLFCNENFKNSNNFNKHIFIKHNNYVKFDKTNNSLKNEFTNNSDKINELIIEPFLVDELREKNEEISNRNPGNRDKSTLKESDRDKLSTEITEQQSYQANVDNSKLSSIRKLGRPKINSITEKEEPNNLNIRNGFWECSICKKICKKGDERREHEKLHRKERSIGVICEQCGKGFRHQRILQIHMRVHTGERPYKCQFCPMAFGQSGALNNHERQHTGEKPYKCNYCDKSFCQSGLWKTHELTHTLSEKPYGCHICEKRFLRPHNLADHIKTHNFKPHKPIPCPSCPKFFKNMKSLTIHQIFHREEAFQFNCSYCEKKFIKLAGKEKHELIHTQAGQFPYECTDCDRKYAHDTSLSKHRRKCHRTGNSPPPQYKCTYCDRVFLKLKSKEKHESAHEMGPKTYECDICNNKYAYKHGLKKHQKKKHNIKVKKQI